jgi:hypothetical protein
MLAENKDRRGVANWGLNIDLVRALFLWDERARAKELSTPHIPLINMEVL